MKYVCIKTCQIRVDGRITFCSKGEIYELPKADPRFQCIEETAKEYKIDFTKATEAELKAANWKFKEAATVMLEHYGKELEKEEGTKKSDVIRQILDIRYRAVNSLSEASVS